MARTIKLVRAVTTPSIVPAIRASDAAAVTWADLRALDGYALWSEAHRIIALARRAFGLDRV